MLYGELWEWSGSNVDGFLVNLAVENKNIEVGEEIVLTLEVEAPNGWEFDQETFERGILTTTNRWFEVMSGSSSVQGNRIVWKFIPKNFGEYFLNASIFSFLSESGEKIVLPGVMIPLSIKADEVALTDLQELTEDVLSLQLIPPMHVDKDIRMKWMSRDERVRNAKIIGERTFPFGLALFLLIFGSILAAIWWWYEELSYAVKMRLYPPLTAKEEAIFALKKIAKADGQKLHRKVSKIMRRYLEAKYKLPFTKLTTKECLIALKKEKEVQDLFQSLELVKFANVKPSRQECQGVLSKAYALIQSPSPETSGESFSLAERG